MRIHQKLKSLLTGAAALLGQRNDSYPSNARRESNAWLRKHCEAIRGTVLSIGSGDDSDGEGGIYRNYFPNASSYTTSELTPGFGCDLTLDVRSMPELPNGSFDCIYCSGVLEHVDDLPAGFNEITRVLSSGGQLLLGLPFRQPIHMNPHDYWRFTEFGIRHLLKNSYTIMDITPIDSVKEADFPAAYWVSAVKIDRLPELK